MRCVATSDPGSLVGRREAIATRTDAGRGELVVDKLRGQRKLVGLLFAFVRHGVVVPIRIADDTLAGYAHWLATLEVQK